MTQRAVVSGKLELYTLQKYLHTVPKLQLDQTEGLVFK